MAEAQDIYQHHLDHVSRALWDRDFEEVVRHTIFPHVVRTADGAWELPDPATMLAHSRSFRTSLAGLGATAYHRICRRAAFVDGDPDAIAGTHHTYVLRGGNYVFDPYEADMVLHRIDGSWMAGDIRVSVGMNQIRNASVAPPYVVRELPPEPDQIHPPKGDHR